jgi:energy-coupling factor transport system substrate-specific component
MQTNLIQRFSFVSLITLAALLLFSWPLFISAQNQSEIQFAQLAFIILMPAILILTITEFTSGRIDSRQLAMLGVLTAVNAFIRMLGAGAAGVETAFFLIIVSAYVFGSGLSLIHI